MMITIEEAEYTALKLENKELKSELVLLRHKLSELSELYKNALKEIELLKEHLGLNSQNSSKPPSSDRLSASKVQKKKR